MFVKGVTQGFLGHRTNRSSFVAPGVSLLPLPGWAGTTLMIYLSVMVLWLMGLPAGLLVFGATGGGFQLGRYLLPW